MMTNLETGWRYPIVIAAGSLVGGYVGAMLATFFGVFMFSEAFESINFAAPWFWRWGGAELSLYPDILNLFYVINGGTLAVFVILGVTSVHRGKLTKYENAHFQSRRELSNNGMVAPIENSGFVYGKIKKPHKASDFILAGAEKFPHAMMIAPSGRGKGVGFVIPNLLHYDGSAIVLDVKGENFEKTSIHRQKGLNNKIWYLSPFDYVETFNADGSEAPPTTRTHRFNPLSRIAAMASPEQQYTALNTMADLFLDVKGDNAKGFYEAGKRLFVASCLFAIEQDKPSLGSAKEIFGGGSNYQENYARYAELTEIPIVSMIFSEMSALSQKISDSYRSVISGAGFQLWDDPSVVRATESSDFDFNTFRMKKQTLYITVQSEHLITLAPLIRLLFAEAIASLQRKEPGPGEPHRVMFLMDEFDQLGRQPMILNAIKTLRSFHGQFFIISQSVAGLDAHDLYGEAGRRVLMAGSGVKVFMTPQEDRTAEVLSDMLGKRTLVSKTESQSRVRKMGDHANISRRSEERPLVSPGELLRFPMDEVLIIPEGQYPIRAKHIRYFADTHFKKIELARAGHALPYPPLTKPKKIKVASLAAVAKATETLKACNASASAFADLTAKANALRSKSNAPSRRAKARKPPENELDTNAAATVITDTDNAEPHSAPTLDAKTKTPVRKRRPPERRS